jgi:hypothetical protein
MSSYLIDEKRARRRLLGHCAIVGRAITRRVPAGRRLEKALGRDQAHSLVRALAGAQDLARRRRVRSSP